MKECPVCKKQFLPHKNRHGDQRFCCDCKKKHGVTICVNIAEGYVNRKCPVCGSAIADGKKNKHCSRQCDYSAQHKREKANPALWGKKLELQRARYAKNPERARQAAATYRENNRDRINLKARVWKADNPDKVAKQDASYRARRHSRAARANDGTTGPAISALLKLNNCQYCGHNFKSQAEKRIDHRHPLALGGLHSAVNLEVCCDSCNARKNAKPFDQWLATLSEPWATKARRRAEKANNAPLEQLQLFMPAQSKPAEKRINPKRAEVEAAKAWREWLIERAPDWWLDGYWDSHPKPWLDHRLSDGKAFVVRYQQDSAYRRAWLDKRNKRRKSQAKANGARSY